MDVRFAETDAEVHRCHPVMVQLRPHVTDEELATRVRRQNAQSGYRMAFVEDGGRVVAVAGFRIEEMLSRGRFLYVDDLVTDEAERSKGYGAALLAWLADHARSEGCVRIGLDSGTERAGAHRFYLREGYELRAHHFARDL